MTPQVKVAIENRDRMLEQGLHPELVKQYLLQTAELQRKNFEIIRPTLPYEDQIEIETILLQGELLLTLVVGACEVGEAGL